MGFAGGRSKYVQNISTSGKTHPPVHLWACWNVEKGIEKTTYYAEMMTGLWAATNSFSKARMKQIGQREYIVLYFKIGHLL